MRINDGGSISWRYVTGDHLGSPTSITDTASPMGEERDSGACPPARGTRDRGDAWGKRRNPDASDDPGCTITSIIPRGFTGHEMLDQLCLINMNARLYDPGLGQFLQADTMVPNPYSFHGYMRYSYVNK